VRRTGVIDFPPGSVIVCYTDGLVERRGELIDVGIERLLAAIKTDDAEAVCTNIMANTGVEQPTDDVAVLAIRRFDR
jgi:serine phosphatase RsbU (regulator of sigma subunit)